MIEIILNLKKNLIILYYHFIEKMYSFIEIHFIIIYSKLLDFLVVRVNAY